MAIELTSREAGLIFVQERLEAENAELRAEVERLREERDSLVDQVKQVASALIHAVPAVHRQDVRPIGKALSAIARGEALATAPKEEA